MSLLTPALEARVLQAVEAAGRRAAAPGALRQVRAKGPTWPSRRISAGVWQS